LNALQQTQSLFPQRRKDSQEGLMLSSEHIHDASRLPLRNTKFPATNKRIQRMIPIERGTRRHLIFFFFFFFFFVSLSTTASVVLYFNEFSRTMGSL
jgi:hypothetical protein